MNIYTVTFTFACNYGEMLQEYALFTYLRELGHNVKVVNYLPKNNSANSKPKPGLIDTSSIKQIALMPLRKATNKRFKSFRREFISYTSSCFNARDVENLVQPDVYFAGSDQIWNTDLTFGYDEVYFLQFKTNAYLATYAASAGKDEFANEELLEIISKIKAIQDVSVREFQFCNELKRMNFGRVSTVLDPVFLLDKGAYNKIAKSKYKDKYVLVYYRDSNGWTDVLAKRIASQMQCKVVAIGRFLNRDGVVAAHSVGVEEFLGLIRDAECVVSSSFHAVAMSIIFQKPFYAIKAGSRSSRITSLLDMLNLKDRYVDSCETVQQTSFSTIDYQNVYPALMDKITSSKNYIKAVLKKVQA